MESEAEAKGAVVGDVHECDMGYVCLSPSLSVSISYVLLISLSRIFQSCMSLLNGLVDGGEGMFSGAVAFSASSPETETFDTRGDTAGCEATKSSTDQLIRIVSWPFARGHVFGIFVYIVSDTAYYALQKGRIDSVLVMHLVSRQKPNWTGRRCCS